MSSKSRLVILEKKVIDKKLNRMACQILECHTKNLNIQFVGLNERGFQLAKLLTKKIAKLDSSKQVNLFQGHSETEFSIEQMNKLNAKSPIILVDDVLNTGRSIFHLLSILTEIKPAQLEICVLAVRHHKRFPNSCKLCGFNHCYHLTGAYLF